MIVAHFVVSSVEGTMITACGQYIGTRQFNTASVGIKNPDHKCPECEEKTKDAWVTFVGI